MINRHGLQAKLDSEYLSLMAELGEGGPAPAQRTDHSAPLLTAPPPPSNWPPPPPGNWPPAPQTAYNPWEQQQQQQAPKQPWEQQQQAPQQKRGYAPPMDGYLSRQASA